MNGYDYIQKTFQQEYKERSDEYKQRLIGWRRGSTVERVEKPTNLGRARRLGYKAKKGYVVVRVRVKRGRRARPKPSGGRKPRHNYRFVQPQHSYQVIAEQKANRVYKNMEVINSYWVGEDGVYKFFEVILGDPTILDLPVLKRKGRAFRGLTKAGRKSRGLFAKGRKKAREGSTRKHED